jgi:hypothetical protein
MHDLLGFLILIGLLVVGFGGFAVALRWFTDREDAQGHQKRLRDFDRQPTPEQRAADRQAVCRWADAELRRVRRDRQGGEWS